MSARQLLTAEEFWQIPDPPDKRYELIHGRMVEYPPSGGLQGWGNAKFLVVLGDFVDRHRLGYAFGDGLGYVIERNPDSVRVVDASFVPSWRFAATGIPKGFCPFAPDLAVEIVSPTDDPDSARERVEACIVAGTKLAWIAFIASSSVLSLSKAGAVGEFGPDDELDGGDVLPGFRVRVAELFGKNE